MDLHLIPYGIIATGHEKGIIEVVQNAKTVAKVTSIPKVHCSVILWYVNHYRYKQSMEVYCHRLKKILFINGLERKTQG